jgi:hypothetical protein
MYFNIVNDLIGFILMVIFSGAAIITLGFVSSLVYLFLKAFIRGVKEGVKKED